MKLRILHWASRVLLAFVFIYSGYTKLRSPLQFASAIEGYDLIPSSLVLYVADSLPWIEVALGVLLLVGLKIRYIAAGAAALLGFFIVILAITYSRGIEANCGCFGVGEPISPLTIARDALFILPALFLTFEPWIGSHLRGETASAGKTL